MQNALGFSLAAQNNFSNGQPVTTRRPAKAKLIIPLRSKPGP